MVYRKAKSLFWVGLEIVFERTGCAICSEKSVFSLSEIRKSFESKRYNNSKRTGYEILSSFGLCKAPLMGSFPYFFRTSLSGAVFDCRPCNEYIERFRDRRLG